MLITMTHAFSAKTKLNASGIGVNGGRTGGGGGGLFPDVGDGSISGVVLENDAPVVRSVMLYERTSGMYVSRTESAADGSYQFIRTNKNLTYFVIAIDDNKDAVQHNLVGQDLITGDYDQRKKP